MAPFFPNVLWLPQRRQQGFTLLEVLAAFLITALALGVLFQGASEASHSVTVSGRYQEALSRARSHLAAVGVSGPLISGSQSGDDGGGFEWRVDIAPVLALANPPPSPRAVLYAVTSSVSWKDGQRRREIRLESRHLGTVPATGP